MEYEVAVRSVPQGFKAGAVLKGETVNPWKLCSHFHRTEAAARTCGEKDLNRKVGGIQRAATKFQNALAKSGMSVEGVTHSEDGTPTITIRMD